MQGIVVAVLSYKKSCNIPVAQARIHVTSPPKSSRPLPPQIQGRRRRFPRRTSIRSSISSSIAHSISKPVPLPHPTHKHLPAHFARLFPLLKQYRNLTPNILDDRIHLDIVTVIAERIFELGADAVDAVEGEDNEYHNGDGPPAHFVDKGEGEDAAEEGEDLFLVDAIEVLAWEN